MLAGRHDGEFPLVVWQTGSGTQTNMNVNEVLANRASELLGGERGEQRLVHPNDDVNRGQSSNDVFPDRDARRRGGRPSTRSCCRRCAALRDDAGRRRPTAFADIVKIGRTHLQDATPLTLGQEFSGYVAQLDARRARTSTAALPHAAASSRSAAPRSAPGSTRIPSSATRVAARARAPTRACRSSRAPNKFEALAAHDALVHAHGALKTLAAALMKIANDVRWLASGPRSGLGEITIPGERAGQLDHAGQGQPDAVRGADDGLRQVMGNDVAVGIGGASGNFELNVYKPLIIHNLLQSVRLLADGCASFDEHCARGIEPEPRAHRASWCSAR